jgi:uncharacterized protein YjiS (DUF1127 family)
MATFWHNVPHTAAAPVGVPSVNFGLIGRVVAWIGERRARAETLRELARLDERDLHDLGISAYDFNNIASGTFRR